MPVPPSSPSVGTRYSTYNSYRPSSSSYLGRTTSLDRTPFTPSSSAYGGSYSTSSYSGYSSYASKYSLPPRPSYSSSSDTFRSSRSLRQSPARPSYSRISSDSHLESSSPSSSSSSTSRYTSRYLRDSSTSRDSGYGSRVTSRDRSVDYVNGNSYDTSHFGASPSSYAANYRWESRDKDKTEENDSASQNGDAEKVRISDRIRAFETRTPARENGLGLLAGRETLTSSREPFSGSSRYLSGRDSSVTRRRGATLSTDTSRSPSAHKSSSESTLRESRDGSTSSSSKNEGSEGRRPSVTELCRKYDTNHNVTNGVARQEDDGEGSDGSGYSGDVASLLSSTRKRADASSILDRTDSPTALHRLESSTSIRVNSPSSLRKDSPAKNRLESPVRYRRESPSRRRVDSSGERDGRTSPLVNGVLDKDEESPRRHQSSYGSISSSGVLSENNGLVGLRNIGNTCFMNSVTQCLSNTRCLLEYLVRDGYSSDINTTISTMKGDLVRAFANLLSDMWNEGGDSSRALNTGPFKGQIQRFAPAFSGYQQHDAQEFLRKLLEGLHEDVNRVTAKPKPITEDIDDDLGDNQKAMESWKRYLRYDDSKIVDMFVGQLKSSLQCSVCGHCSVTFDPFWDLSLPIPSKSGQVRLSQCLDLFTKEEVLDGDERPTCSKCKERRKMTKTFSIQKFPKVLVLHLKRFSPLERWRGKLSCTVEFPLEGLDLSKFASSSSTSPYYNLIGVANHSGTTYSGHYTAYCKHPYSGSWHEYNDSRVSSISPGRVCSPEAYVLFYEISSTSSKL
ncbi:ubiquitin carboxyl-terminal hydrolase 2-like isoform X2 [Eriocheir sinensis]|uniref:ubiquitin carboxyl-terminal hydrolase 2-like isoform X2 n=1 Tax=Eriocheir sinensis TaxID=95602 RepID=UPI0021C9605C|nr:ubiquitin carboxyl-terminal hydrolase 2-like isoform X2 [Eriocheir sinensis]